MSSVRQLSARISPSCLLEPSAMPRIFEDIGSVVLNHDRYRRASTWQAAQSSQAAGEDACVATLCARGGHRIHTACPAGMASYNVISGNMASTAGKTTAGGSAPASAMKSRPHLWNAEVIPLPCSIAGGMSHGPLHKKNSCAAPQQSKVVMGARCAWLALRKCMLRACSHGRAWSQNKAVVRFRSTHDCDAVGLSRCSFPGP